MFVRLPKGDWLYWLIVFLVLRKVIWECEEIVRGAFVFHRTGLHNSQLDQSKSSESAVSANSFGEILNLVSQYHLKSDLFTSVSQDLETHRDFNYKRHPFKPLTEGVSLWTYSSTLNENGHQSRSRPTGRLRGLDCLRKRSAVAGHSRSIDPEEVAVNRLHHIKWHCHSYSSGNLANEML